MLRDKLATVNSRRMKSILGRVFCFWALLFFSLSLCVNNVFIFLVDLFVKEEPRRSHLQQRCFRRWMRIFLPAAFCPVKVSGEEIFNKKDVFVVVQNHNSFLDIPVTSYGMPEGNRTLAKIELAKVPVFGYMYRTGSILVDRKNRRSRYESMKKMQAMLESGVHLCLYPEGTRNKSDEVIGNFQTGAFRIAVDMQKDIVPTVILGTKNILSNTKKFWFWPQRIEYHFMPPISVKGLGVDDVDALMNKTHKLMKDFIEKNKEKL